MRSSIEASRVPLKGILNEFRTALEKEIEAASQGAEGSAVSLLNGRRIAQVGGNYQYLFNVENVLNLPSDSPGDLFVSDHPPLQITVISIDGMIITLSVPEDLGQFVPIAKLKSDMAYLMRILIRRIEELANNDNPVVQRVLGKVSSSGDPVIIEMPNLNKEQSEAVASSIGRNITFIGGPPGTGKSRTIGAIGEQLYHRKRSVLLVSHTNIAVDQALIYIGEALDPKELSEGHVLRVGEPKDQRLILEFPDLLASTHVDKRSAELSERRDSLKVDLDSSASIVIKLSRQIDICEWVIVAVDYISAWDKELVHIHEMEEGLEKARNEAFALNSDLRNSEEGVREANKTKYYLAESEAISEILNNLKQSLDNAIGKQNDLFNKLTKERLLLEATSAVGWLTRKWKSLPNPEDQEKVVISFQNEYNDIQKDIDVIKNKIVGKEAELSDLKEKIASFQLTYSQDPDQIIKEAESKSLRLNDLHPLIRQKQADISHRHKELGITLSARLSYLRAMNLTNVVAGTIEEIFSAIKETHEKAFLQVAGLDIKTLRQEKDGLNQKIKDIEKAIDEIEEALKRVEEIVISEAAIVATTLTRAYLRDSIQKRRFDTVILDEASMAPIPALWVASNLANNNAVVVGDHMQLPPIVQSDNEYAQKWLGRDIFEVSNIDKRIHSDYFISLRQQFRMHPDICAICNNLIYDKRLENGEGVEKDHDLDDWYNRDWGHDHPVLLIDTQKAGAWVTSVRRGSRSSRLNFLSATICIDIVDQLLKKDRPELHPSKRPRILIVSPYRPHAQLLNLLIKEHDYQSEVVAGTAHSFQGSEADVVIFDLVNDEPHWRVGMFDPKRDKDNKQLLNVALTRSKKRLIIVGDFNYINKLSKNAFIGKHLIPFLLNNYCCVNALDIVPANLSARVARAHFDTIGGGIEVMAPSIIVTQDKFYPILLKDIEKAKSKIIIYSAFITSDRLGQIEPHIRAALDRKTRVYVVTKPKIERAKGDLSSYRYFEKTLKDWGVTIIHKKGMHEKVILIDDNISWIGSLNVLSFSNTQEIMERRSSNSVMKQLSDSLRVDDLIAPYVDEDHICPICGDEMIASEGRDEPFYWRCTADDCYTRNINEEPLKGDVIICSNCRAEVEFGEWGNKAAWRCIENKKHHQRVGRTHLMLRKMRDKIPRNKLKELDKIFNINRIKM